MHTAAVIQLYDVTQDFCLKYAAVFVLYSSAFSTHIPHSSVAERWLLKRVVARSSPIMGLRFFPEKLNYIFYDISKTCNFQQLLKIFQGLHQLIEHFLVMTLRDIMQLLEDRNFFATVLFHSTVAKFLAKYLNPLAALCRGITISC